MKKKKNDVSEDPLARAEELRSELSAEIDKKLNAVGSAIGDDAINKALLAVIKAHRRLIGFSNELFQITGRSTYAVDSRRTLADKVGSEFLRRRIAALKGEVGPVKMPGEKILEALKEHFPPQPKIFEGAAEWKQHLEAQGLKEQPGGRAVETAFERRQKYYGG